MLFVAVSKYVINRFEKSIQIKGDHLHCCPHGYTCDVEHSKCEKKFDDLNDVPCPGGMSIV